jgi:hypothetical protein
VGEGGLVNDSLVEDFKSASPSYESPIKADENEEHMGGAKDFA